MLPETQNFQYIQGDSQTINLDFDTDISNWTIILTIKESENDLDSEAIFQKKATIISASDGTAKFDLSSDDTSNWLGNYKYDMQYKDNAGNIVTFLKGRIQFEQDITKSETI